MKIDFEKYPDKSAPVIVQDSDTHKVLMLGFMNNEALETTLRENKVVFFSRSKQRLWMKGEQSGNFLYVKQVLTDCDNDTLLIKAKPAGPVCHTGSDTCFNEINEKQSFIYELEQVISDRKNNGPESSYTFQLFNAGLNRMAQKLGEEAVETVIAAKDEDPVNFLNEAADLFFHYLVLLQAKGFTLDNVEAVLKTRHKSK
jgi:phosphoribosyl-AMP cyclohydrolase / phosphoribosyl-ATP pyrophosphohydrolase